MGVNYYNMKGETMSIFNKVFNTLVVEGKEASAKQMANYFGTTVGTVQARISEIRTQKGIAVYENQRTDSNNRTTTFYRVGTPTRAVVAAGYRALAAS
jgi:transcription initiation factor IIE alpha subunit